MSSLAVPMPTWRARGPLTSLDGTNTTGIDTTADLLGVTFADIPDDELVLHTLRVVEYAFRRDMRGLPDVQSEAGASVHGNTVVAFAPLSRRRCKTRSIEHGLRAALTNILHMHVNGSPVRADGTQLFPALARPIVGIRGFSLGHSD